MSEKKYLDGVDVKRGLPFEFIEEDAKKRLLVPLFDFKGEPEVKFETEKEISVYLIGHSD